MVKLLFIILCLSSLQISAASSGKSKPFNPESLFAVKLEGRGYDLDTEEQAFDIITKIFEDYFGAFIKIEPAHAVQFKQRLCFDGDEFRLRRKVTKQELHRYLVTEATCPNVCNNLRAQHCKIVCAYKDTAAHSSHPFLALFPHRQLEGIAFDWNACEEAMTKALQPFLGAGMEMVASISLVRRYQDHSKDQK